jgi:molybdate transport repressor ModE-like protein
MRLPQLRALVALAETGTIRGAARKLGLSQNAISRSLKDLETATGAKLLERRTHGTNFTPAGQSLVSHARLVMTTLERAESEVKLLSGQAQASVRIAVTAMLVSTRLPRLIEGYHRTFPDGSLDIDMGTIPTSVPQLIDGRLDVSFSLVNPDELPSELAFQHYREIRFVPVAKKDHLPDKPGWEGLLEKRWLVNPVPGSPNKVFLDWMEQNGLPLRKEPINVWSTFVLSELTRKLDCVSLCPEHLVPDIAALGVVPIEVDRLPPPIPLGAVYLRHMPQSEPVRYVLQTMEKLVSSL